jgi:hypothetical protein
VLGGTLNTPKSIWQAQQAAQTQQVAPAYAAAFPAQGAPAAAPVPAGPWAAPELPRQEQPAAPQAAPAPAAPPAGWGAAQAAPAANQWASQAPNL